MEIKNSRLINYAKDRKTQTVYTKIYSRNK